MFTRKIIFYPKSAIKPIILTDSGDHSAEEIKKNIKKALNTDKISILETESDILIIRPSEIQGVLITKSNKDDSEDHNTKLEDSNKYEKKLMLDKKWWKQFSLV